MIVLLQMAQLVDDDIFNTLARHLDQPQIEGNLSRTGAAPPLRLHFANSDLWTFNAVTFEARIP